MTESETYQDITNMLFSYAPSQPFQGVLQY